MEQLVRILLTTLNYKTLRKKRKRQNSGQQEVKKTAKTSFLFLLPNGQSDNLFNSEAIHDSVDIQNTATVISAIWVSTVTLELVTVVEKSILSRNFTDLITINRGQRYEFCSGGSQSLEPCRKNGSFTPFFYIKRR